MAPACLLLPPRAGRLASLWLSPAYALSVAAFAVGEWGYYLLAGATEVAMLIAIGWLAWTWRVAAVPRASSIEEAGSRTGR